MSPRRNAGYCDSIHTIVVSPGGTSFLSDLTEVPQPATKGPLNFILKAIAACGRSSKPSSSKSRKNKPSISAPMSLTETQAVRRLLSPPSYGSLVAPSIASALEESQSGSASLNSRASMSSLYTASAASRSSTPSDDPVPHVVHPYANTRSNKN